LKVARIPRHQTTAHKSRRMYRAVLGRMVRICGGRTVVFLAQKSRRGCCISSGELAYFPRRSYCTFRNKNSGCCFGTNFEGNHTTKGTEIEELPVHLYRNFWHEFRGVISSDSEEETWHDFRDKSVIYF
jgi:hypothetical protein